MTRFLVRQGQSGRTGSAGPVYPDTLNTCLDELDRGFYFHFLFIFSGFLILRDNNKDTPAGICNGI